MIFNVLDPFQVTNWWDGPTAPDGGVMYDKVIRLMKGQIAFGVWNIKPDSNVVCGVHNMPIGPHVTCLVYWAEARLSQNPRISGIAGTNDTIYWWVEYNQPFERNVYRENVANPYSRLMQNDTAGHYTLAASVPNSYAFSENQVSLYSSDFIKGWVQAYYKITWNYWLDLYQDKRTWNNRPVEFFTGGWIQLCRPNSDEHRAIWDIEKGTGTSAARSTIEVGFKELRGASTAVDKADVCMPINEMDCTGKLWTTWYKKHNYETQKFLTWDDTNLLKLNNIVNKNVPNNEGVAPCDKLQIVIKSSSDVPADGQEAKKTSAQAAYQPLLSFQANDEDILSADDLVCDVYENYQTFGKHWWDGMIITQIGTLGNLTLTLSSTNDTTLYLKKTAFETSDDTDNLLVVQKDGTTYSDGVPLTAGVTTTLIIKDMNLSDCVYAKPSTETTINVESALISGE